MTFAVCGCVPTCWRNVRFHVLCSTNDQHDILQLLQVPLVCHGALDKDQSVKPLLVDCTTTYCILQDGVYLHNCVNFQRCRTLCFVCS